MSLQLGIIGMPNVGKSTLLNALTHARAEASNYPFCTIEKNIGVTTMDDPRLRQLAAALHPEEVVPATIQFVDIAGLVRGASKGQGLGNRFLGHIREADALVHVVRDFQDEAIVHVDGTIDPRRDLEIVLAELMLADLDTVERHEEKLRKQAKGNPREVEDALTHLRVLAETLKGGLPVSSLQPRSTVQAPRDGATAGSPTSPAASAAERHSSGGPPAPPDPPAIALARELCLLTLKPSLIVVNVDEAAPGENDPALVETLRASSGADVIALSIRLEEELSRLPVEEGIAMRAELGLPDDPLRNLIEHGRRLLGLITFYTIANDKLRAWLVPAGTSVPRAAGRIHTDMERGFIRAEVFSPDDLRAHGSRAELHKHGLIRVEGKEYAVRDGDVIQILFHA